MTHTEKARTYVDDVLSGRIDVCRWIRLACQRHVDDLAAGKYFYDEARANRACKFKELFCHVKGKWSAKRQKFILEPWQCFVTCSVFGWIDPVTELRRFRKVYECVPRKNGKSIDAGATGDYMFLADHEAGPEVYSGATSEKQAFEIFRSAKQMIERTPAVKRKYGVFVGVKVMTSSENGGRFEVVIGKPGDGSSPSCGLIDEYHEHDTDSLVDTMITGMGAREQPLLYIVTTAGSNLAGPCRMFQDDCERMLEGSKPDETLFAIIYTIDQKAYVWNGKQVPADDWTTEAALRKANPNYGISVMEDFLKTQQSEAIRSNRKQNIFLTKHLNVWVNASSSWMNMVAWGKCADAPPLTELAGVTCYAGLDLSSKSDITARVKVFKRVINSKEHYYGYLDSYLPSSKADDPAFQHYQSWAHDGLLKTTPGAAIDMDVILDETAADITKYKIKELAFDKWGATHLAQSLAKRTPCQVVEFEQQVRTMSDPMKHLEALVNDGRFHHDNNPIFTWMISNVVCHEDAKGNIYPRKVDPNSPLKIDGVVACIMALSRAMLGASNESIYETRGVR